MHLGKRVGIAVAATPTQVIRMQTSGVRDLFVFVQNCGSGNVTAGSVRVSPVEPDPEAEDYATCPVVVLDNTSLASIAPGATALCKVTLDADYLDVVLTSDATTSVNVWITSKAR